MFKAWEIVVEPSSALNRTRTFLGFKVLNCSDPPADLNWTTSAVKSLCCWYEVQLCCLSILLIVAPPLQVRREQPRDVSSLQPCGSSVGPCALALVPVRFR
ncbi:hypothetical protein XENOCAPTIV_011249 [Xenoophorus captivus]|uniref:Uncharacterized protein n=1 Tax=Xenoophorus captivus TaxID=1517983 RepID=A0ABV0Q5S9_9TELE